MRVLIIVVAFLVVTAWQCRNNRPVFFVVVGSIFAIAAVLVSNSKLPERILESLSLAWAACMLVAGVSAAWELAHYLKRKKNATAPPRPEGTR
jgi:hypothetical protein